MFAPSTHSWTARSTEIKTRGVSMRPACLLHISRMVSMAFFFGIIFYTGVHSAQLPKAKSSKTTQSTTPGSMSVQPGPQSKTSHPTNSPPPSTFASASPADIRQGNSSGYASTFSHLPIVTSQPVIVNLDFYLPDPFFCKRVNLEHLQHWTQNVARATREFFLTGSNSEGPDKTLGNIPSDPPQAGTSGLEDPTLDLSWNPVCRATVTDQTVIHGWENLDHVESKAGNRGRAYRENGQIERRNRDSILYNLFQDPDTCIIISTPSGTAVRSHKRTNHKRDVQINLQQQMSTSSPGGSFHNTDSLPLTTSKEAYDGDRIPYTWDEDDSEGVPSQDEDYYHDISAMASILWQKSYIGASGTAPMHDARTEPVFTLTASISGMGAALAALLDHFQWQHVVILSGRERYWSEFGTKILVELVQRNFKVKSFSFDSDNLLLDSVGDDKKFKSSDKGVLLCMNQEDIYRLLFSSKIDAVINKHRAVFAFNPNPYLTVQEYIRIITDNRTSDGQPQSEAAVRRIMEYLFILQAAFVPEPPPNDTNLVVEMMRFNSSFTYQHNNTGKISSKLHGSNRQSTSNNQSRMNRISDKMNRISDTKLRYLDVIQESIQLAAYVINKTWSCPTMTEFKVALRNTTFRTVDGLIIIDRHSMVHHEFLLYDFKPETDRFEAGIVLRPYGPDYELKLIVLGKPSWPNGWEIYPDPCFKIDHNCPATNSGLLQVISIAASLVGFASFACLIYILIRRYVLKKKVERGPNKILLNNDDLTFMHRRKNSKMIPKASKLFGKPDLLRASEQSSMSTSNELSETASYNGDMIYVKDLKIKYSDMKSRPKIMSHLKMLRELRHENMNPFVGFLNDPARPSFITEYCTRGSLEDVIRNFDIKLDWDFKLSLLTDLVRGCRYIHSCPLKYHGHLKSRNCVIDSRWVLKITDYGIPGMLEGGKTDRNLTAEDMLWFAPEMLRNLHTNVRCTDKSDVYSFSIVMQEIILRNTPYCSHGLSAEEIIQKVKKPPPLIRPSVSPQAAPPQYIQLMKQCWAESPDMRPDIETIYHQFKEFNNGKKMNFVDTMFKMLEKYSNDLEDIVRERTMLLEEEKKKTDELLYRMLPSSVAESLKCGKRIEAENYSDVSIYFSDIVGFTSISAKSTAMQVVDLLNELYTMFDATIDNYDVYKVETIGDAYMVVSGLPVRNSGEHAGEICTMALDLLYQCGNLRVRHLWNMPLLLRIGLHTGPCAAGVVGLRMPRYCLFGDTVNTASRMESTGLPLRIHLSQSTKSKLDELGGYKYEYRGEVELKGKGMAITYWLVGKEGFNKELPKDPTNGMEGMNSSQLIEEMLEKSKLAAEKGAVSEEGSSLVPGIFTNNSISNPSDLTTATNVRQEILVRLPPAPHTVFTSAPPHEGGRDLVAIHTRAASQSGGVFFQGHECLDTRPITRNTSYATGICKSWGNITKVDSATASGTDRFQAPGIVKSALRRISSHKFDKRESKLALPRRGSTPKPTDCLELKVVLSKSDQIFNPDTLRPTFPSKSGGSFRRRDYSDPKLTFLSTQREEGSALLKVGKPSSEAEKPGTKELLLASPHEASVTKKLGGTLGVSGGSGSGGVGGRSGESATSECGRLNLKRESRKIKALDTTVVFPLENVSVIAKAELFESKDACLVKASSIKKDKANVDTGKDKSPRLLQGDMSAFSTSNV